ncbi:MAG: hypothetical protein HUU20_26735 [Pirellulales bacterium]|nr:hypothetical protein [Pirellulales bacterium]
MKIILTQTPANQGKIDQVRAALDRMFQETLRRGFYGTVGVEVTVNDGTILQIRQTVGRVQR